jgi:hypothetical protein
MVAFHGTADTTIPFNGGTGIGGVNFRLPIDNNTPDEDVMDDWQIHNGCTSGRTETTISSEVRRIEYDGCVDDATVELYAVDGGGHTWPGAIDVPPLGYTTHDISATQLMWQFFQAHPFAVTPSVDTDGDTIPNASDADNDNDGCSDAREAGTDPLQGGARNAKNFWDYGDMPDLSTVPMRDGKVRVNDIVLVVQHYFDDDGGGMAPINRNSDPLSVPPPTGYHPAYDRGAIIGPHTWDVAPPDGQIRVNDILFVVSQYYNDCS